MRTLIFGFTLLLLASITLEVYSQKSPARLGSVDKELFENDYSKDFPDASAVVLFDFGDVFFEYHSQKGFQVIFNRHTRLKILNKDGLDWANGSVSLYRNKSDRELISKLNGFTHHMENGKIVSRKLGSDGIFQEEISENLTDVRFTMPNVLEGSVLEYSYTITSDFYSTLPEWYFQNTIPVLYSEFNVKIPEYFKYKTLMKGYEPLASAEEKRTIQRFVIFQAAQNITPGGMRPTQRVPAQTQNVDAQATTRKWISTNVPAFVEEPYLTSSTDYLSSLEFELSGVEFPGELYKNYTTSWEDIRKTLMESDFFGRQLRKANYMTAIVEDINARFSDPQGKMIEAYQVLQGKMSWNGKNRIYTTKTLRDAYNEGVGSSADINLLLVVLLRDLGFNANPVIISTRNNGKVHPARVMLSKFNYVIAHVRLNDKEYLLDATDSDCPYFLIPERCLNEQGRIINETFSDWVSLKSPQNSYKMVMTDLILSADNLLTGKVQHLRRNYSAYQLKGRLSGDPDYSKYKSAMEQNFVGMKINDYQVENLDLLSRGVKEVFALQIADAMSSIGNMLYFSPMLHERIEKNPFLLEERKYPVDYGYPIDHTYMFNLEIPEGFVIDDLPEDIRIALPDNAGLFTYQSTVLGNRIQLVSRFQMNNTLFVYSDYKILREFYDIVVNKHAEQIVLKKI